MNQQEADRRARLMKMRDERLPDIKKQFEAAQKRNFNANFAPGGKDAALVGRKKGKIVSKAASGAGKAGVSAKSHQMAGKGQKGLRGAQKGSQGKMAGKRAGAGAQSKAAAKKTGLGVSVRKGEMVHHQRMLSQDVNAQATQHIIGIPVNKSRYNGYNGEQVTNAQLKAARPDPEAVRVMPLGGVGEFGIGKNMTLIEYKGEIIVVDMGSLGGLGSLGVSGFFSCLGGRGFSCRGFSGLGISGAFTGSSFTGSALGTSGCLGGSGFFTGAAALGLVREAELRATLGASGTGSGAS